MSQVEQSKPSAPGSMPDVDTDHQVLMIKLADDEEVEPIRASWQVLVDKSKYFALLHDTPLRLVDNNVTELGQFQAPHVRAAIDLLLHDADHWPASNDKILAELIEIADYLQTDELLDRLHERLRQNLFPSTVLAYLASGAANLPKINLLLKHFMLAYGWRLIYNPAMLELSPRQLTPLLDSDHLVAAEVEVGQFVYRYLKRNEGNLSFAECLAIVGALRFDDIRPAASAQPAEEAKDHFAVQQFFSLLVQNPYRYRDDEQASAEEFYAKIDTVWNCDRTVRLCNEEEYYFRVIVAYNNYEQLRPRYMLNGSEQWPNIFNKQPTSTHLRLYVRFGRPKALRGFRLRAQVGRTYTLEVYRNEPGDKPYNWETERCSYCNVERGFSGAELAAAFDDHAFNWLDEPAHEPRHHNTLGDPSQKYLMWQKSKTTYDIAFREVAYITELILVFQTRPEDKLLGSINHHRNIESFNLIFSNATFYHRLPKDFEAWNFTLPQREDPDY